MYTFSPPSCPSLAGASFNSISTDSTIMSWTYGGSPLGYGYEYGAAGFTPGTGTIGTTAATTDTIVGLTPNTNYDVYFRVLCAVGDTSMVSGPFTFATPCNTFTAPYTMDFETSMTNTPDCWTQTGLESWLFRNTGTGHIGSGGTLNGATASGGYFAWVDDSSPDNTSTTIESPLIDVSALTIPRLTFFTISDNEGDARGNVDFHVDVYDGANWIDSVYFNDTNTAGEAWEKIAVDLSTLTITGPIKIRFVVDENNGNGFDDDRAIDDVVVEETPNCPATSSLGAYAISATDASIYWTENGAGTSWRVEYGPTGFTLGTGTISTELNDTASLTGLAAFTTYDFYVRALCTASDSSVLSLPFSFTTLCNDTNLGPWMDDVEGHPTTTNASAIANCWSSTNTASIFDWNITNGGTPSGSTGALSANSGDNFFYTEASGAGVNDTAILTAPSVDLTPLTTPFMEFYYHMTGAQIGSLSVEIYNGTTWTNELTITGAQQPTQADPWNQQYIDLSSYSGVIQMRFIAVSNGSFEGDISLDDIAIIESPPCFSPTMVSVAGTLNDSTTASWMAPAFGSTLKYLVQYDTAGFVPGTGTIDSTLTTSYGIGGLLGATTYDFYVRSYCGGTDSSTWVGPITFTTQCDPLTPTYSEDFTTYLPTCWEEANGLLNTASVLVNGNSDWKADGFANVGFTGAASMNVWSTGRNDWLISAPIDLGDGSIPYQVEYDVALTDFSSTGTDAMGSDDTLALVISTDFGQTWTSANILRVYVSGDEPSNAGNREFLDLSAYTGIVKFGFYAASSVSNADYDVHIDNFLVTNLCVPTAVSYTDTACGTYTSPSGKIFTAAGTYQDTIPMVRGCDSVLTITLVVNNTTASVTTTVCDSYTAPSGMVYTTTGMYMDTIPNSIGCDSIVSINLTVNYNKVVTDVITVCNSYTRPGGSIATFSSTYYDTIPTSLGCDSAITTVLTVNYDESKTLTEVDCGSYTSPSGKVWTTSGSRFDTIPTSKGCDSLLTINLTIKASTSETRTITSCFSYTVPETGMTYAASGTYTDVTTNAFGCPHTITTILTINTANAGTVNVSGITMTATATGVSYKWVDCDNNFSFLLEDTMQSYTPPRNGNYACWITTTDGCKDTTACVSINTVSLEEYIVTASDINIFPNPASDFVTINILNQNSDEAVQVRLFDTKGKLVYSENVNSQNNQVTLDVSNLSKGVYTVTVFNEFFSTSKKITVIN